MSKIQLKLKSIQRSASHAFSAILLRKNSVALHIDVTVVLYLYYDIHPNTSNKMLKKSQIRAFFNSNPPVQTAWRAEALQLCNDLGRLVTIANKVFGAPVCSLDVFDNLPAMDGVKIPAVRLNYPNGAKIELYDSLSLYSVSLTSPDCDLPARLLKSAYHPEIDWSDLYRPGMPGKMAYPPQSVSPRQFTFKTHDHNLSEIRTLVTHFSWIQKQAMGLTQRARPAEVQQLPAQAVPQRGAVSPVPAASLELAA